MRVPFPGLANHRDLARLPASTSALVLCLTLLSSCSLNPVSGRPEFLIFSERQEKQLGQTEAQQMAADVGLVGDAVLSAYLTSVGERVAQHSPRERITFRFHLLDATDPNAFALPAGDVYVTRGLIALLNSEDQLAAVLAHEIAHIAGRHTAQRLTRMAPFALVTNVTAQVIKIASPALGSVVGGIGHLAGGLLLTPFSREQEREADQVGQQMVVAGGWDPAAVPELLTTLDREQSLAGKSVRRLPFFESHPSTPERIEWTNARARELARGRRSEDNGGNSPSARASFVERLSGLVIGPRAADGVFEGQTFQHPDLELAFRLPRQWRGQPSRHQLVAFSPKGTGVIAFELVAEDSDPLAGARALEKLTGASLGDRVQPQTIGSFRAARSKLEADGDQGPVVLELVWVAHAGRVVQISGLTQQRDYLEFQSAFEEAVKSLRALAPSEIATIRENRLRIVKARANETVEQLVDRSKSVWSPEMVGVVNGIQAGNRLVAGWPVKVAIAEPYRPTR